MAEEKKRHGGNWWEVYADDFRGDQHVIERGAGPLLWEICRSEKSPYGDDSAAGWDTFFAAYPEGATYVAGETNPGDFPLHIPKPYKEMLVKHAGLTFCIQFGIGQILSGEGEVTLELEIARRGRPVAGMLNVKVNGEPVCSHFLPDRPVTEGEQDHKEYPEGTCLRTIKLPADALRTGNNRLEINHLEGGWLWFERLALYGDDCATADSVQQETSIERAHFQLALLAGSTSAQGQLSQPLRLKLYHYGAPQLVEIRVDGAVLAEAELKPGLNHIHDLKTHPVEEETFSEVVLQTSSQGERSTAAVRIKRYPVRALDIHLVHHTHLDIGYTHTQEDVLERQIDHFNKALEYIQVQHRYPEEAKLRWHPEGMWALDEFLRRASDEEKQMLIQGVKDGYIHIDALYAQVLTGLLTEEEAVELFKSAGIFSKMTGVPVVSIQMTDIPGITWGLLSVLAQYGIRYICLGPNPGHRIGHIRELDDKPFYWEAPDGKSRVLMLVPGQSYNHWHWNPVGHRIQPDEVFPYVDELTASNYPYDCVLVRYNIEKDNGAPNPALPDVIQEWNEKYITPKLISDTNSGYLRGFEDKYGESLPVVRGDLTPYWEDGAASTALATAMNRKASEQIAQAQILWSLLKPNDYPYEHFDKAWDKNLLFDEHTWGAWCSILQPDNPFTIQQNDFKHQVAVDAERMSSELIQNALKDRMDTESSVVDVLNTSACAVTQLILLTPGQSAAGDRVESAEGDPVPSQRLASGELAFRAEDVPGLGSRRYVVMAGMPAIDRDANPVELHGQTLKNGLIELMVNPQSGGICSIKHTRSNTELVDQDKPNDVNDFIYITGRSHEESKHQKIQGPVKISIEDHGPLVGTMVVESEAPGCNRLTRTIQIQQGSEAISLTNIVDKKKELEPEAALFAFPLNIPEADMSVDTPFAVVHVGEGQLPQANRNYITVQRWLDVSNDEVGLTWVTVDAPMVQYDPILFTGYASASTDAATAAKEWRKDLAPGSSFFSWIMNNHWETNYKAYQDEVCRFRYVLQPHKGRCQKAQAQSLGRQICQPLIAVNVRSEPQENPCAPLQILSDDVAITSIKPSRDQKAFMVRLFNISGRSATPDIRWIDPDRNVWISNPMEEELMLVEHPLVFAEQEVITLKIV